MSDLECFIRVVTVITLPKKERSQILPPSILRRFRFGMPEYVSP